MSNIFETLPPNKMRYYIAIDLKSFYASVECQERGLDPLTANLVVADTSRTEKTICLAVTPSLKAYGISGRARLFEVTTKMKEVNRARRHALHGKPFTGKSVIDTDLKKDPSLEADFIAATPRMALYMKRSAQVYSIYLKYISSEDIHVYSVDEVFMDVTDYLKTYGKTPHELALLMIRHVLRETGITATAGIGTNMYLAKIAMDIVAKHMPADKDGVRIAELNEETYRRKLWTHRPLTDFWRVGKGYEKRLKALGILTMGDIAECAVSDEDLLYDMFGVNAELLIDHAFGYEPCTIQEVKAYKPKSSSTGQGQVLMQPYPHDKAAIIVREMAETLALDLVDAGMVCDQVVLDIGYDIENLKNPDIRARYKGPIHTDHYGRQVPEGVHGSRNLDRYTASSHLITEAALAIYEEETDPILLVRRVTITANHVIKQEDIPKKETYEQLSLFTDQEALEEEEAEEERNLEKEKRIQQAMLSIRQKYGKNAILKGTSLQEGATMRDRNKQIGGHKA